MLISKASDFGFVTSEHDAISVFVKNGSFYDFTTVIFTFNLQIATSDMIIQFSADVNIESILEHESKTFD